MGVQGRRWACEEVNQERGPSEAAGATGVLLRQKKEEENKSDAANCLSALST